MPGALLQLDLDTFLEALASDAPAPGGGAVAALAGAMAADLGRMVCRLRGSRAAGEAERRELEAFAERLRRASVCLRRLIDEDAAAYAQLNAELRRPKHDPQRAGRVAAAAGLAAAVPLEVAKLARRVGQELQTLEPRAGASLACDVRVGQALAAAAVHAACDLVRANLPLLTEGDRQRLAGELESLPSGGSL